MFDKKIEQMLSRYKLDTIHDHENALKEIIQEIALLGLWRSKFYEKAVFTAEARYGFYISWNVSLRIWIFH